MGHGKARPLIYLAVSMAAAAILLHALDSEEDVVSKAPLSKVLSQVPNWSTKGDIPLDENIIQALDLDDYLFRNYAKDGATVTLYIGLYRVAKKVGAAHSPLVCFPGQGWVISKPDSVRLETPGASIQIASMTASKGKQHELLFYWFQARGKTSRGTLMQKIYSFAEAFRGRPTDNAFVRISIPIEEGNSEKQRLAAMDFIRSFYPIFLAHVTEQRKTGAT